MLEINVAVRFKQRVLEEPGQNFSFLNLASIGDMFTTNKASNIIYFCDGMLLAKLISFISNTKIERVSFDFTSIADSVFKNAASKGYSIYFVGANGTEIESFVKKIYQKYPTLEVAGYSDGYFKSKSRDSVIQSVITNNTDIVIASLGAGVQEEFLNDLTLSGFSGIGFTCGGFIRQESLTKNDYYPQWINYLKLRAFYRMYKEPHTIKRYFLDYPLNLLKVLLYVSVGKCRISTRLY